MYEVSIISVLAFLIFFVASRLERLQGSDRCEPKTSRLITQNKINHDTRTRSGKLSVTKIVMIPARGDIQSWMGLYHQFHNIEDYPSSLPLARRLLVALFSECISAARGTACSSILSIGEFNAGALEQFVRGNDQSTACQWESYVSRRRAGRPRELFESREDAVIWLKQKAPVKYVDGSWLGHIHKVDAPFHLRAVTRSAWQILSEELGDGDLDKSHVNIYRKLMRDVGLVLPDSHDIDFIHPRHSMDDEQPWKAAVVQLAISLFPLEFLPELLGFNLHFEMLTLDTLKAIKELREVGIDQTYFLLHVCIDNNHSGHAAMATQIVIDYMRLVANRDGLEEASRAWTRIQAGFLLSESFVDQSSEPQSKTTSARSKTRVWEPEVLKIFEAKAIASQKLHSSCAMKLGGNKLEEWLVPHTFESREQQESFIRLLSEARPWIVKGDRKASKLMQSLEWGGKMFGAFTETEIETIGRWIDDLGSQNSRFVNQELIVPGKELFSQDTYKSERSSREMSTLREGMICRDLSGAGNALGIPELAFNVDLSQPVNFERLIPLWFLQSCLLESFLCVPSRTCTRTMAAVIRILRAQHGFVPETGNIAGTDELNRSDVVDLITIGYDLTDQAGWARPQSLHEVMKHNDCEDLFTMLSMSRRPTKNEDLLLGMSYAFTLLHTAIANHETSITMEGEVAEALRRIAKRERAGFGVCREEVESDPTKCEKFLDGFIFAKLVIQKCFQTELINTPALT